MITEQELLNKLGTLKANKASGPDGILHEMIKYTSEKKIPVSYSLII